MYVCVYIYGYNKNGRGSVGSRQGFDKVLLSLFEFGAGSKGLGPQGFRVPFLRASVPFLRALGFRVPFLRALGFRGFGVWVFF